jgi:predicted Zn-dependent protease with MMP-like domain
MDRGEFEVLVVAAVDGLPDDLHTRLENVAILVEDWPSQYQLAKTGLKRGRTLLGLYEGVPLTKRGIHYGMVPPDKITIFQKPIEAMCRDGESIVSEVQRVVRHEIAHHFGIGEAKLRQIEEFHRLRDAASKRQKKVQYPYIGHCAVKRLDYPLSK